MAVRAARLSEAFADALTASVGEGVYAIDLQGRLTFMNPAASEILGWSFESLVGREIHDTLHGIARDGTRRPASECDLLAVVRTGVPVRLDDEVFVHRDGHLVPIACSSSPIVSDGEIIGAVVAFHDITEQKQTELRFRTEAQVNETLLGIATTLNAQRDLEAVVQLVADAGTVVTGAAYGAFFYEVDDERGDTRQRYAVSGVDRSVLERLPAPRRTRVFGATLVHGRTIRFDDVTTGPAYGPDALIDGIPDWLPPVRSYLGVPVRGPDGEPIGGLFFGHPHAGVFTAVHERLVEAVAAHAAVAVGNARQREREQRVSETLQRSMLPRELPLLDGVAAVARYLPAQDGVEVGGDWYDVVPLRGDRVGIVIGDVAGHNLHAASVMGEVRNAVRAYAIEGHSPCGVVERANRFLCALAPDELATCCYVELQPSEGMATVVLAGHPPPIIAGEGAATFVPAEPGLPLGVDRDARFTETTVMLPVSGLFALYTDGLVERVDVPLGDGLEHLLRVVAGAGDELDAAADAIVTETAARSTHDDSALLLVSVRGAREHDESDVGRWLPADAGSAGAARQFVADVLHGWSLGSEWVAIAELLVSELVTNAVLHTTGALEVRVRLDDDRVRVSVCDESGERPARLEAIDPNRASGRGLLLVDELSDLWGVDDAGVGKIVWFELGVR